MVTIARQEYEALEARMAEGHALGPVAARARAAYRRLARRDYIHPAYQQARAEARRLSAQRVEVLQDAARIAQDMLDRAEAEADRERLSALVALTAERAEGCRDRHFMQA